jgi:hypothetical protein
MPSFIAYVRVAALAAMTFALSACGGGGSSSPPVNNPFGPSFAQCDPGTQVQLANPLPGQGGVSPTAGSITLVANGNNNTLYNTYQQWFVVLTDSFGNSYNGGPLQLVSFPNGPHPYNSDFYYSSSIQNLPSGRSWSAGLVYGNGNCSPAFLGNFST